MAKVCGEPKVFIGQIPMDATKDDVLRVFGRFGKIKSASLMTHPDGRSKGCAMVLYEKWSEAEAAMEECNGNPCLGGDRALVVNFADPPKRGGGVPPIAPKTLFVGQVPKEADENEVQALFAPFGEIVEFHVSRKGSGSAGCAFVKYNLWAEAERAMERLHGKQTMTGAKNPLVVKFADAKNKESSDSQVGAKRPIGEDPWLNNTKRPFQGQANGNSSAMTGYGYQGSVGMGSGWPQTPVQMGSFGYANMGRGMGFGNMMGSMGGMPMGGMGSPATPAYGMGSGPYGAGYSSSGGSPYNNSAPYGMMSSGNMMNTGMGSMGGMMNMSSNIGMGNSPPSSVPASGPNGRLGPGITDPRANEWKLFVGQVPFDCTERDLWPMFAELGEILELVILRIDGRSRGCAFVTYADRPTAERAIGRFNGQVQAPGDTRGKKLVVRFAERKKEPNWNGASQGQQIKAEA